MPVTRFLILVLTAAALLRPLSVYSARLYYSDQPPSSGGAVISVALDGTDQRLVTVLTNAPDLRGIAYHQASGRIYFLDNGAAKKIFSILPNGTDRQEIVPIDPVLLGSDLEIDEEANLLYWSENNPNATGNGFIKRVGIGTTNIETAVTTAPGMTASPYFIFVDGAAGFIYWGVLSTGSGPSRFFRATSAGVLDTNFVIATATRTRDIAVDPSTAIAYWCDRQTGNLYKRAVSSGTNQTLITGMNAPHGIALDVEAQKVYWVDTGARGGGPFNTSARRAARCNFDGTQYENLSTPTPTSEPWDLALDLGSRTYADWRTRFFSTNSPSAGPNDDAESDGASNLLEYGMGTQPRRSASLPRLATEGTGMRYTRRIGSELTYRVEASTDLALWHYNGDGSGMVWTVEGSVTPAGPELESVVVTSGPALTGASNVFFRVRVAMP